MGRGLYHAMGLAPARRTPTNADAAPIVRLARVRYRTVMGRPLRLGARAFQHLAGGTALLLCSTLAAGELHLHDAAAADEYCIACGFAPADLHDAGLHAGVRAPNPTPAMGPRPRTIPVVALPFAAERSRAPPPHS